MPPAAKPAPAKQAAAKPAAGIQMTKTTPAEGASSASSRPAVVYETSPEVTKLLARANAKSVVPSTTADRVELFLDLSDRLARIMAREQAALNDGRYAEVSRLISDKQKLTLAYEEIGRLIRLDQAGTAALPTATKAALLAATRTLRAMVGGSADAQKISAGAQRRLVETLVRAFNQEHKEVTAYSTFASQTMRNPSRPPRFVTRPPPLQVTTYNTKL
ncbi:hypothetical protein WCLP8_50019 [uncultured Gammaproteobacteria bacterium]